MDKIKNSEHFEQLCNRCVEIEPKLGPVISQFGYPPFWHRNPDFPTLILTILEQQVSLASAKAAFVKLTKKIREITPENFLRLTDEELRACYFSRQKTMYSKGLANEIVSGKLNLKELNEMSEDEIRDRLIRLKGIGNWTVDMYVLMSLHFADIFPAGDLATVKSAFELELVPASATKEELVTFMKKISPHRTVATYILWHSYIQRRNLLLE